MFSFSNRFSRVMNKRPKGPHIVHLNTMCNQVEKDSANQKPGWPSCFSDRPSKHKLSRGRWDLTSCQVFVEFHSAVSEKKSKMSQPIRGKGGHLVFPIGPKNTNLVEEVEILLPVNFHWIPFSGFREEVENVSDNQRPGPPSCFSNQPDKTQTW